jgi:threonine synthase
VVDPHTAVGIAAARKLRSSLPEGAVVCLATAHPAKFPDAVRKATGIDPELPDSMKDIFSREQRFVKFPASSDVIKEYVMEHAL